jgi:hypothetical protein
MTSDSFLSEATSSNPAYSGIAGEEVDVPELNMWAKMTGL